MFPVLLILSVIVIGARPVAAEPVSVQRAQGTIHGFLALKTLEGNTLAVGDLVQVSHGDRVVSRLTFRFRDGSLDDETTVFSQRKVFQLISDHHIQRGPSFPQPLDLLVNAATGQITSRDKDGKVTQEHFDLAPDISNGLPLILLLNVDPKSPWIRLSMVTRTAKPRLVPLAFTPVGEENFSFAGVRRMATNFRIKIELGGDRRCCRA